MESQVLNEMLKEKEKISKKALRRESCRVAAAFGIRFFKPFNSKRRKLDRHFYGLTKQQIEVTWVLDLASTQWTSIHVFGGEERYSLIEFDKKGYFYLPHSDSQYNEVMARGLFCLGIEDKEIWRELPNLSTHEKLELRLSMPREFWPQKWLEEED